MKLNPTRAFDVFDPITDEPRVLVVQLTEEGVIADLFDVKFENAIATWGRTDQELVESLWGSVK